MDNNDDEQLLSLLGVTAANPEDIERHVVAAAEESARLKKKGKNAKIQEITDAEGDGDVEEASEEDARYEALLRSRLKVLDQEIKAVAAGLESLERERLQNISDDDETEEVAKSGQQQEEKVHELEGFHLQQALANERLASLQEKRSRLSQKLATFEAGLLDACQDDDEEFGEAKTKSKAQKGKSVNLLEQSLIGDDELDSDLGSASGFVETERDRLIRTGVVTPFDRLKGFERRLERATHNDPVQSRVESSIANAAASMAAIAKARPTSKLLDASELPKLAPPTREFRRIQKGQRYVKREEKVAGERSKVKKRKRPLPDSKWRKKECVRSDLGESSDEDISGGSSSGEGTDTEDRKVRKLKKERASKRSDAKANREDDVLLEGGLRIPFSIYENLFDYQRTGIKWLWELHCQKAGGIIADEMGLGKTIQVAGFLGSLHYSGLYKPSIVVCPVTLLRQWKREVEKWYGALQVEILHDSVVSHRKNPAKIKRRRAQELSLSDYDVEDEDESIEESEDLVPTRTKHVNRWDSLIDRIVKSKSGLLITTYEQLRILREKLLDHEWGYAVLDEGHRIRNPDAEVTLVCKQLQTVHRIIMTGAPIQNKLTELWSLFDFVFPGKLGVLPVFQAQFSLPIAIGGYANATPLQVSTAYKCAVVLRDLIMPYLLRRLKLDVNAHLTKKTEHVLFCSLTEEQRAAYRAFLGSSEVEQIFEGNRNSLYGIDILRKICNHSDLLEREQSANHPDYGNPERSGKLKVLAQVLDVWKSQGHKVLIFSQTQQMLDIIETYVISKEYVYRRMDGSTPIRQRMALIDEFNGSSHVFVFILTTKVGGLGTNLTGANKVVIFDPDWNPSTDMQARERAWRIGQTRDVTVYRLITRGTIEEKVYHRQIYKHFLTNKILKDPKQRRVFKAKDLRDLFTLNEDGEESKTETSTLFAEVTNVELSNDKKQDQSAGTSRREGLKAAAGGKGKGEASLEDDESHEDESRILKCLFEANGIHSALNHDAIESMDDLEKMKIDSESARVAQQAAAAVMQSRLQRRADSVAVPTWTGRSGAAGAPVAMRRQFGSTSRLISLEGNQAGTSGMASQPVVAGVAGSSNGRALRSSDVLARIRGRVGAGAESASAQSNILQNGSREGTIGGSGRRGPEPGSLAGQLRSFIERQGGQVSSTAIVEEFKDIVPAGTASYFRQVLKEVADLRKEGRDGMWVLKEEYT